MKSTRKVTLAGSHHSNETAAHEAGESKAREVAEDSGAARHSRHSHTARARDIREVSVKGHHEHTNTNPTREATESATR